ncbi:hypothetical protein Tco_0878147 [Tanacetum coccineum]|uniref:Uncharacterized protein n=1 Tax=Tanacetum coccineum TaxID=301880 RepID=A0ABQ5BZU8_9ASTR
MSDSDESGVTYTEVSSPFEDLSNIGSPRADDYEYLELPGISEDPYVEATLQAPPSPDYVPGLEEPEQAPPSPKLCAKDASPTAQLPDYVSESDPEADPEEDDDEDPEEDPVDYSANEGDDRDDEDEPSEEDEDDDVDMEVDGDEEEEEHLAPTNSIVVALPTTDQAPSVEETEPFETDESAATPPPHPAYRVTTRISIPALVPTPVWFDAEVARLIAISTPPSSPLSPWSSPLPQIPSPSLPLSPPSPVLSPAPPLSPIHSLGYRAAMIQMRAKAAFTSHSLPLPPPFILSPTRLDALSLGIPPSLPISVPTSPPPLLLPSASRESSSAATARPVGGLRVDYGFVATIDREIRRDPEREVGYGITDSWDEIVETLQGAPVSTDTELGRHTTSFETRVRQDTDEIYTRDRRAHAYTRHQMETEARLSQEAWRRLMDASNLTHGEVMSLRTSVLAQMSEIRELHAADRRRQAVISEMLKADFPNPNTYLRFALKCKGIVNDYSWKFSFHRAKAMEIVINPDLPICSTLRTDIVGGDYSPIQPPLTPSLEVGSIRRIQVLDTAYWGFLGVGITLDIFQNIHILYLEYGVLSLSRYGVLSFIPLWSLVSAGTNTPYLP